MASSTVSSPNADRLAVVLPALAVFAVGAFAPQMLNDGDTWWHVRAGEWMLDHRAVLHVDPFSYSFAGRPWRTHEWLSEVLMGLGYRAAGWPGVQLLFGLALAGVAAVLSGELGRRLPRLSQLLVLVLALACMSGSWLARPHVLALPLLALWTRELLVAREQDRAPSLWLAPLMALWANLHGSFALGLALMIPFALEALGAAPAPARLKVARGWGLAFAGALAGALATPHGIQGLLFPLDLMGMKSLAGVAEWRPSDFSALHPFELCLLAGLFVIASRGVRLPLLRLLVLLGLVHLALHQVRHQMLLAVIAPLLLAEPLGQALRGETAAATTPRPMRASGGLAGALGLAAVVLIGLRLCLPTPRPDGPGAPVSALAHVPAALRAQPVFNDYGLGGYLIFAGVKPFIDGRTDMYGDAFLAAYDAAEQPDAAALPALLQRWRVRWTLLDPASPVVSALDHAPGWRRLYADRWAVVHERMGVLR